MKKFLSLFLCLILLFGLLPLSSPARASTALAVSSVKSDKTSANVGATVTWTATASGGSGTLQYYFIVYKDGTKVKTRAYSTANTFSYTPTEAGTYKARVYVKDSTDAKVNKLSAGVTVTEATPLSITSIMASKTTANVGSAITWTATATGGSGTLQYYFIVYKDGTKVKTRAYSTANTFTYTPTEAGVYKARVYVKDTAESKVTKLSKAVTVTGESTIPVISSIKANKTTASTGESITWTATASGGLGTLKYYFIIYKDGTKVKTRAYSTARTFTYTPTEAGSFKARVYVKDADGTKISKQSSGVTVSEDTGEYALVTYIFIAHDHSVSPDEVYYAQAITDDGAIVRLPISKTTYNSLTVGNVYRLVVVGSLYEFLTPGADECSSEAYTASDPQTDYTGAVWIWHNGKSAASLRSIVCKARPKNGSNAIIVYRKEKAGTSYVRKVKSVWFLTPATAMPAIKSIKADKSSTNVGETVTWTATASGGAGTLKYYFILYKDGNKIKTRSYSTKNTFSYTPAEPGNYKVRVYVKDAVDLKASKQSSGVTVSEDTGEYALVTYIFIAHDHSVSPDEVYYAQAITDDGAIVRLPISKTTYNSLTVGNVYRLVVVGSLYEFLTPGADECSSEAYTASDPQTDYTGAVWIWHNGKSAEELAVKLNVNKPKTGSNVIIVYTTEQAGVSSIREVKAVWFQTAS